jgi:hypothetical protein
MSWSLVSSGKTNSPPSAYGCTEVSRELAARWRGSL